MMVIDPSCLYEMVVGDHEVEPIRRRMAADEDHAPHPVDVEVLGAIRCGRRRGKLDATTADQAIAHLRAWPGERFGHRLLSQSKRAWQLPGHRPHFGCHMCRPLRSARWDPAGDR
jgi:predicted nucleic acid-binding protein